MKKIKVGIVGYGNLGKALEKQLTSSQNIELVFIATRRIGISSPYSTLIINRKDIQQYYGKINILFLAGSSNQDIENDDEEYIKHFNIINTFDTHAKILTHYSKLNKLAKKYNHIAILSAGWDPGLFSFIKAIFYSILETPPVCFWGKGTSLGHSAAARKVPGVIDAISFTIPNKAEIKNAQNGNPPINYLHSRKVYILKDKTTPKNQIETELKNIPYYFKGEDVKICFVNKQRMNLMRNFSHSGRVICCSRNNNDDNEYLLELFVKMSSNPMFTAKIVAMYIKSYHKIKKKYKRGCFTPLSFSATDLIAKGTKDIIKMFC